MAIVLGSFGSAGDGDWQTNTTDHYVYNITDSIGVGLSVPSGILHISGAGNILTSGIILHDITNPDKAVLWITSGVNGDGAPQLTGIDLSTLTL